MVEVAVRCEVPSRKRTTYLVAGPVEAPDPEAIGSPDTSPTASNHTSVRLMDPPPTEPLSVMALNLSPRKSDFQGVGEDESVSAYP
jgi:hypothetical protein